MSFLLDTSVISELVKPAPDNHLIEWLKRSDEASRYFRVVTIGEIEKSIAKLPSSSRREMLEAWLRRHLAERFHEHLLAIDALLAGTWGRLVGETETRGEPLPAIDGLIAATSLAHDLAVATRNIDDFEHCGARCFDPCTTDAT